MNAELSLRSLLPMFLAASLAACSSAPSEPERQTDVVTAAPAETKSAQACTPKTGTDPEALAVCHGSKGTAGRCVPLSYLEANADTFETGDCSASAACVPDDLVRTGGAVDLKACTAFGREGRCFWPLAKQIAASYEILLSQTKDQCDPGMVCAPCVSPLDGERTGVCEVSAKAGDCTSKASTPVAQDDGCKRPSGVDPTVLPACRGSHGTNGRCVPSASLGEDAGTFEQSTCGASSECVPDDLVRTGGAIDLEPCKAFGGEGRCFWPLSKEIAANYDVLLSQTGTQCEDGMVCAPCVSPLDGKSTGVCELSASDACE